MTSFPWSLVYLVVSLGIVFFVANWLGERLDRLNNKIRIKADQYAEVKREKQVKPGPSNLHEAEAKGLVAFFIGNGGYQSNGLDTLFTEIDSQEINEERMYEAIERYGINSVVPILREARVHFDNYHAGSLQCDIASYFATMQDFERQIEQSPDVGILKQAYETKGASLTLMK